MEKPFQNLWFSGVKSLMGFMKLEETSEHICWLEALQCTFDFVSSSKLVNLSIFQHSISIPSPKKRRRTQKHYHLNNSFREKRQLIIPSSSETLSSIRVFQLSNKKMQVTRFAFSHIHYGKLHQENGFWTGFSFCLLDPLP
jgi:hypothetical protein